MLPDCSPTRLGDPAPRILSRVAEYDALETEALAFGMSPETFRREVFDPSGSMEEARHLLRQWVARVLAPDPEPPGDILDRIDATVDGLCPCGAKPAPGSAWCSPDCEPTHAGPDTDAPRLGGPCAARWRPDLVTAFDDSDLELIDRHPRRDTGLDYCVYTYRSQLDVAHLRVDDGHRFVGIDVPWSELEASGPSDVFRRLERELTDSRRLDPDPDPPTDDDFAAILRPLWDAMDSLTAQPPAVFAQAATAFTDEDLSRLFEDCGYPPGWRSAATAP